MSIRADGSIIIDTKINTEKASSQLLQLENKIVKTSDRISELTKKMQQMKDAKVPTEEYQQIATQISKAEQEFDKLLAKQEEMQRTGRDSGAAWQSLQYKMEEIGNTIRYAKGELQDLVDSDNAFTRGSDTLEYENLARDLRYANNEMNALCHKHEELEEKQKKNTKEYSRMSKVAGSTSKKAGSFVKSLTSGFKGLNKHVKTGNGLFGQMGTRLKGLALSLLVFNWISKGWNAMISGMKEGIQNLAKYSDEFNQSMSELKSSTEQAKNALATAFAPVISALIPYIVGLINIVNTACDAFARFWAYLSGKSTYTRAKKQNLDYADSLDGIANSAKKALGALAGFDELNVISQNEDSAGGSGDGSGGGDLFEEVPIGDVSDWLKKLKEAILAGDWYSVGALIGQKLTEAMNSIPWEDIYEGAREFGTNLALFLNGLVSPELFGALGRTIAGALNTLLYALFSFSENFDFENAGKSFGTLINEFFATFDFEAAGKTISNLARGLLKFFISAIKEIDWKNVGENIVSVLANIDWAGILGDLGILIIEGLKAGLDLGAGLYDGLAEGFANIDWNSLGEKFIDYILGIDWGGLLSSVGDFLVSVFFANLNLAKGVAEFFASLKEELQTKAESIDWQALTNSFNQFFEDIGELATEFFDDLYAKKLQEFVKNTSAKFSEWWNNSVKPWFTAEKWSELWDNVRNFFVQGWNNIVLWWTQSGIYKWYNENVKGWFDKEKWTFSGIKEGLSKAFNDAVDALKKIWDGFKEWIADKLSFDFEFNMPELGGGSTSGSSVNGSSVSTYGMPYLADGAVIRGGSPFMAVLGDQPAGQTNIETPLNTMVDAFKQAYAEVGADMGGEYTFIAQLDGRTLFKETVRRNQMYKKTTGQSAYT